MYVYAYVRRVPLTTSISQSPGFRIHNALNINFTRIYRYIVSLNKYPNPTQIPFYFIPFPSFPLSQDCIASSKPRAKLIRALLRNPPPWPLSIKESIQDSTQENGAHGRNSAFGIPAPTEPLGVVARIGKWKSGFCMEV